MPSKRTIKLRQQKLANLNRSASIGDTIVSTEIANCRERGNTWLRLAGLNLDHLPPEILTLNKLQFIDLSNNNFKSVPEALQKLPNLGIISLAGNPLEQISGHAQITVDVNTYLRLNNELNRKNLEVLIDENANLADADALISHCKLNPSPQNVTIGSNTVTLAQIRRHPPKPPQQKILESIDIFNSLKVLSLRGFRLNSLPENIRNLRSLRRLRIDALDLVALPKWISEFQLEFLSAIDNKISTIPDSFANLQKLTHLDLSWNSKLTGIPTLIFQMKNLENLRLHKCNINSIPPRVLDLKKLTHLDVGQNPIELPPHEVTTKGIDAIRNYWRQLEDSGVDYLCEAKLIILGEPGAGKTSLARKIRDLDYALVESEKSTEGIDVITHQFTTGIRTLENGKKRVLERTFQANIWDFGGQEIYHATHQFFLTRRSVYVLVCDNRKEDTDFSYWLNIIEMLSNSSPLLIVQNEKQDRSRDISLGTLRGRFQNLRSAHSINLATNRGLKPLIQAIEKELESLPHIGAGLPATWKRVREVLEKESRDHIKVEEYLSICQDHGFSTLEDKLQLSEYLHDLGICLHFQTDPVLKNIVILKPSWGTDAVYRVLDDPAIIESRGRFTSADLERIWAEEKYRGMQHELLQLMIKFQLCYALVDKDVYIAPQLLSADRPQYGWQQAGGLTLRYEYKFLPKGIITRFIVSMHHLIANELVWRTGVVLERDGSKIEIIEEYSQRIIKVRATGPNRHGLLTLVDEQLERLHRTLHNLQYEKFLPCQCVECRTKAEQYGFSLEKLIKMANKSTKIQCHESGELIDAAQLMREVLPGSYQSSEQVQESNVLIVDESSGGKLMNEVFVSYAWGGESGDLVDKLQATLQENGIKLLRDKDELSYKDSIRSFMQRLGKGKCIVVVISEKYLKSENCMYELLEISKATDLRERIFPIILKDANIYKPLGRVAYVKYWEDEAEALDEGLKSLRGADLVNLQQDLNLYAEVRRSFDTIAHTLRDMNALSASEHEQTAFDQLISRVKLQLAI